MKKILFVGLLLFNLAAFAQQDTTGYVYSLQKFREKYIKTHDVIKGNDTTYLNFFPIDSTYRVTATFEKVKDDTGFVMQLSENKTARYFKYGKVSFTLQNKPVALFLYQSKRLMKMAEYKDYLFIPFIDLSNGAVSYGGGRYLDIDIKDIKDNKITIDFNKAYNPSCSYTAGYNCPIPPGENTILLSVNAGEKTYAKPMH